MYSIKTWADGISLLKDNKEIAFYNKFLNLIRVRKYELDFDECLFFMHEIIKYKENNNL